MALSPQPDGYGDQVEPHPSDSAVRCWRCARLLAALVTRPWSIKCSRCKAENESPPPGQELPKTTRPNPVRGPSPVLPSSPTT